MILPTKNLSSERALLSIGAEVLRVLDEPKTVSRIWNDVKRQRVTQPELPPLTFDWFVLALDFLFIVQALRFEKGRIRGNRS
ncbi:MAG: ABC-three component system middle component 6 [Bacilli bacterium]